MSEKRFNLSRDGADFITHILDFEEEKLLSEKEVLDCLNMQNNEIKKLKNNFLIDVDDSTKIETYKLTSVLEQKIVEQQATINKLQDKLFAMQHTIDNQENAIFHLKDTDDNLRKKNIKIEELSKVVHNLKMVLSNNDEQVAKIVGEQQSTINNLQGDINRLNYIIDELRKDNYKQFQKIKELEE